MLSSLLIIKLLFLCLEGVMVRLISPWIYWFNYWVRRTLRLSKFGENISHDSTKLPCYAAKAHQRGTIRLKKNKQIRNESCLNVQLQIKFQYCRFPVLWSQRFFPTVSYLSFTGLILLSTDNFISRGWHMTVWPDNLVALCAKHLTKNSAKYEYYYKTSINPLALWFDHESRG